MKDRLLQSVKHNDQDMALVAQRSDDRSRKNLVSLEWQPEMRTETPNACTLHLANVDHSLLATFPIATEYAPDFDTSSRLRPRLLHGLHADHRFIRQHVHRNKLPPMKAADADSGGETRPRKVACRKLSLEYCRPR